MSRQLLYGLNGGRKGHFARFLDQFSGDPRIAWYPSAGQDFRALMYLHPAYVQRHPAKAQEPPAPDLFLYTDYFPWQNSRFLDSHIVNNDSRTTVLIDEIEELPRLDLPLHERLVHFPKGSWATGRVIFMKVRIESNTMGRMIFPVVYAFVENVAFYCKQLVPNKAIVSHLIHVRYGGGFGGGSASGVWLIHVLSKLCCELYITNDHHHWQSGDEFALRSCPEIPGQCDVQFTPIRVVPSQSWSGHGDVVWKAIKS